MNIPYDASREALFRPQTAPTAFGSASDPGLQALAVEASRLAYLRAEAAEAGRLATDLAAAGFGQPAVFVDAGHDAQAYAAMRDDRLALIAFRATEADRLADLLTDAQFLKVPYSQAHPGRVHQGFLSSARALESHARAWLDGPAAGRKRLVLCCHSLGAAIATLLAVPLGATHLVTIGSPRVGDAAFAAAIDAAPIDAVRIVDARDVVTRVPPRRLFGYRHTQRAVFIDVQGVRHESPTPDQADADLAPGRALAIAGSLVAGELPRDLTDHAAINYVRADCP